MGKIILTVSPLPTWESISDVPKIVSQPGRAFPTFRKSFPNLGGHFRHSENRFPTWEGISDAPKIVSQLGRAFPTLRKSFPKLGEHFRCSRKEVFSYQRPLFIRFSECGCDESRLLQRQKNLPETVAGTSRFGENLRDEAIGMLLYYFTNTFTPLSI